MTINKGSGNQQDLIFALKEDIGNPRLFSGRKAEIDYFLNWIERAKEEFSQSHAIMARKRRGKTALVQRLYNILYTRNDPQVIPFYYRVQDSPTTRLGFADRFYRALISQYLGFKLRQPELVMEIPGYRDLLALVAEDVTLTRDLTHMEQMVTREQDENAWEHAREAGHRISSLKDERIIQFIDEFQFLNEYIYLDKSHDHKVELGRAYQSTGASKVSPQIITGSYIGWLAMIIRHMVDRFDEYLLDPLPPDEALALVYNYSSVLRFPVTDNSAAYMAEVCQNDPFYIAALFQSRYPHRDLTSEKTVRDTLMYEIALPSGKIGRMWQEYTWHAFDKLNDRNAKEVVLYLARYGNESRSREQILEDRKLDISDRDLEVLLHKLWRVDMVAQTGSNFDYKGLGDPIFEMVFRRMYQREIERVDMKEIDRDLEARLKQAQGRISYYKGQAAEYRVINRLLWAMLREIPMKRLVRHCPPGLSFGPFESMHKQAFHLDQVRWLEVDVFARALDPGHADLVIEIKDWEQPVSQAQVEKFVSTKKALERMLNRPAAFLFHAERGLSETQEAYLAEHGVMCSDGASISIEN